MTWVFPVVASVLVGVAVGGFVAVVAEGRPWLGVVAGGVVASGMYVLWMRRELRRRRLSRTAFPEHLRRVLREWVGFYRSLPAAEQRRFEEEVRFFLDEQTITGPRGAPLGDELRVLVAASAVVLIFGRPGFRYPRLRDIVVYDEAFDEDYAVARDGHIDGMVHAQGPILLSARSLRKGFRGEDDGQHVGYHEFAHALDYELGEADGVPGFMPWRAIRPWLRVMHDETAKIAAHRSLLREYAATNPAEFFAVATEAFFERPEPLRRRHPELYRLLVEAYGQDHAARGSGA